ncbi:MAG: hypothetical protein ACO3NZ_04555 [Pirellulales bacterium]
MAHCSSVKVATGRATALAIVVFGSLFVGCQSHHLNSQLLERELRLQEDQIYRLQDVLDEKCARLEYVVQENASLKRQLGYGGSEPVKARTSPSSSSSGTASRGGGRSDSPSFVPPTIELSDPGPPSKLPAAGTLPAPAAPPVLEGVPPLPQGSGTGSEVGGGDAPPASGLVPEVTVPSQGLYEPDESESDPSASGFDDGPSFAPAFVSPQASAPRMLDVTVRQASVPPSPARAVEDTEIQQLSYVAEEVVADEGTQAVPLIPPPTDVRIERIEINRGETQVVDTDANGSADALAVVFEPRDLQERLIGVTGDVVVTVREAASAATASSWTITASDAASTFRSTSRSRGLRFLLPWQGGPSRGFTGTVHVRFTTQDGRSFESESPISLP